MTLIVEGLRDQYVYHENKHYSKAKYIKIGKKGLIKEEK